MDVETILNQIRERVVSEESARLPGTSISRTNSSPDGSAPASTQNEALARLGEYLTVTGRAWNQLPPVFSSRRGTAARIELWIKNTCKPLTRWFTWEQVNFNRAVHDALTDVIKVLMAEAQELAALRSDFELRAAELRALNRNHAEYEARLKTTDKALAGLSNMLGEFADETRTGRSQLASKIDELAAALREEHSAAQSQQAEAINRRLSELAAELKEEQRVCFRQLSLEASEAAILEDRGRRALDARLEKLEKSLRNR